MAQRHSTNSPVISVINMKGGVGKTQVSANVFLEVWRRKKIRILLIDFDPQFNLTQLLINHETYEQVKNDKKTLMSVIAAPEPTSVFQVSDEDLLDVGPVDLPTHRLKHYVQSPSTEIRLLPGDFDLAQANLRETERSLRLYRRRFRSYIDRAREGYDLIVLDCNPSTSFLTRCALEVSTHLLVPIRPDRYSVLGIEMLLAFVDSLPTVTSALSEMVLINGMPSSPTPAESAVVNDLRANVSLGPKTLVASVPQSDVLKARPGYVGFAVDRRGPYHQDMRWRLGVVADEIVTKIGL